MRRIGRYDVVAELGRGGMGAVFKAWDPQAQAHVAIKLLLQLGDARQLSRFRREAQILQRLQHPHVVPVREYGEDSGRPYLVMDLVPGESLDEAVAARGPLPVSMVAELGLNLAQALESAHRLGILHRDVKPSNVLLRSDGQVVLTDFGLAKDVNLEATQLTVEGGFMGTLGFAAPEQATGKGDQVGPASDVYGLGATLYYTLSGRPPFEGQSLIEIIDRQQRPPPPLSELRPEVPDELAALISCCLEAKLPRRYRSCELVARDLSAFLSGEHPAAPRDVPRSPAAAALAGVALAAALGVGAWFQLGGADPEPPPALPLQNATPSTPPPAGPATLTPAELKQKLEEAIAAYERDEWGTARLGFERILEVDPNHAETLRCLWLALRDAGDPAQHEVLRKAVAADPHPSVCVALAEVHLASGDDAQALEVLERGLVAYPDSLLLNRRLGNLFSSLGDPARALPFHQRTWSQEPAFANAVNLASCLHQLERDAEALPLAEAAVAETPSSFQANFLLGLVLNRLERYRDALVPLERVWSMSDGDYPPVVKPLAYALREVGRSEDAVAMLSQALARSPNNADWLVSRALNNSVLGRGPEELADLDAALRLNPRHPTALNNRSVIRFGKEDYAGALADARQLSEVEPSSVSAWTQIGACAYALEDCEPAAAAYGRAIDLQPENALLYVGRAQALRDLNRLEAAIVDYAAALERDPSQQSARWQMGKVLYDLERKQEALGVMREMLAHSKEGSHDRQVATTWIGKIEKELAAQTDD